MVIYMSVKYLICDKLVWQEIEVNKDYKEAYYL